MIRIVRTTLFGLLASFAASCGAARRKYRTIVPSILIR
jgi:hypothetical protein